MTTRAKRVLVGLSITLVVLIGVCIAYCLVFRSMPRALPAPTGRFGVGRLELPWRSATGRAHGALSGKKDRGIAAWVWYPTEIGAPGLPARYAPQSWIRYVAATQGVRSLLQQNDSVVRVHAIQGAPLAPDRSEYPAVLLVAAPRTGAFSYTTLAEQMASNGWIVVGITIGALSTIDPYPAALAANQQTEGPADRRLRASRWAKDILLVLELLRAMNIDEQGPLASRIDFTRIALIGVGFGGTASNIAADSLRPTIPVVNLGSSSRSQSMTTHPLLVLQSDTARVVPDSVSKDTNAAVYSVRGSTLLDFSDFPYLFDLPARLGGAFGSIEMSRMRTIVYDMIQTFIESAWMSSEEPNRVVYGVQGDNKSSIGTAHNAANEARFASAAVSASAAVAAVAEAARQYPEVVQ